MQNDSSKKKASISNDEYYSPDDHTNDDDDVANEEAMLESTLYFTQARSQRVHANEQVRLAKKDYGENSQFNRNDYAQNLQLTCFGEDQPGDTFYFSPLNIHVFGIVNHSPEHDQMHGYLHHEGEGKKGTYNIASLIK